MVGGSSLFFWLIGSNTIFFVCVCVFPTIIGLMNWVFLIVRQKTRYDFRSV